MEIKFHPYHYFEDWVILDYLDIYIIINIDKFNHTYDLIQEDSIRNFHN